MAALRAIAWVMHPPHRTTGVLSQQPDGLQSTSGGRSSALGRRVHASHGAAFRRRRQRLVAHKNTVFCHLLVVDTRPMQSTALRDTAAPHAGMAAVWPIVASDSSDTGIFTFHKDGETATSNRAHPNLDGRLLDVGMLIAGAGPAEWHYECQRSAGDPGYLAGLLELWIGFLRFSEQGCRF